MALKELLNLPDNHHRKISNVTLVPSQDLISLVNGSRFPGSVINTYGVLLQQQCKASGIENCWVFSTCCNDKKTVLFTHAHSKELLYNLGKDQLHAADNGQWKLAELSEGRGNVFARKGKKQVEELQKLLIRIPGKVKKA
jgi:hypothetical protein